MAISIRSIATCIAVLCAAAPEIGQAKEWRDLITHEELVAQIPADDWCEEKIRLRIIAPDLSVFRGDRLELQKLVGGVQVPLKFKCSDARSASLTGIVDGRRIFRGTVNFAAGGKLTSARLLDNAGAGTAKTTNSAPSNSSTEGSEKAGEAADRRTELKSARPMAGALHDAALHGKVEKARQLIEDGADVNATDEHDDRPLHNAATLAQVDVARLLIQEGADVSATDEHGNRPLHAAAGSIMDEARTLARVLIQNGADVNAPDGNGNRPLHGVQKAKVARLLIDEGASVNVSSNSGETPLHNVTIYGQLNAAEILIEAGADVNATDDSGETPLHEVAHSPVDDKEIIEGLARVLIEADATLNAADGNGATPLAVARDKGNDEVAAIIREAGGRMEPAESTKPPAIHRAASDGDAQKVKRLIEENATVDVTHYSGATALHKAANADVARVLIEQGAAVDATDSKGYTPLYTAETVNIARLLIDEGAAVDARDDSGRTPLYTAETVNIARLLIDEGAAVDARDDSDRTPLHREADSGNVDVVRVLIEAGATVDARDDDGSTPLRKAITGVGRPSVVRVLLEHGASMEVTDDYYGTLLNMAIRVKEAEIAQSLIEAGADINARDYFGDTPLHHAASTGQPAVAESLIEAGAESGLANPVQQTPLAMALDEGNDEVAAVLREAGGIAEAKGTTASSSDGAGASDSRSKAMTKRMTDLRRRQDRSAAVLGSLPRNSPVYVQKAEGQWCKVTIEDIKQYDERSKGWGALWAMCKDLEKVNSF